MELKYGMASQEDGAQALNPTLEPREHYLGEARITKSEYRLKLEWEMTNW